SHFRREGVDFALSFFPFFQSLALLGRLWPVIRLLLRHFKFFNRIFTKVIGELNTINLRFLNGLVSRGMEIFSNRISKILSPRTTKVSSNNSHCNSQND